MTLSTVCLHHQNTVSSVFYSTMTLKFDLLIPKSETFFSVSKRINAVSLVTRMCLILFQDTVLTVFGVHTYGWTEWWTDALTGKQNRLVTSLMTSHDPMTLSQWRHRLGFRAHAPTCSTDVTDGRTTCDRKTAHWTVVHRAVKRKINLKVTPGIRTDATAVLLSPGVRWHVLPLSHQRLENSMLWRT